MECTFVFVSRGRYERDERIEKTLSSNAEEELIPKETKLYENYPNPLTL